MDWIVFLVFLEDGELPLASAQSNFGSLVMIGQNRKQRWRHEAYKFSHPTAGKFKSSNCLQFYATLDRLIGRKFYLLVCPREPEEASAKQAGGKISEIVSESEE